MITYHEIANIFPLMQDDEYQSLKADIEKNGLLQPIWIYEGKILDGRNRFKACQELGIEPDSAEYIGHDPLGHVVSLNLQRRHLDTSQRAMVAANIANLPAHRPNNSANLPTSQSEAAEMLNVSERSIRTAKQIQREAIPELQERVVSGDLSLNLVSEISLLPKEEQKILSEMTEKEIKNIHVANNSGENEWYTPSQFIESARLTMGSIDCDPASSVLANETVKSNIFFTKDDNGLEQEWIGNVWMNPPYAQPLMNQFSDKWVSESKKNMKQSVVLVNNATETKWFQNMAAIASAICFPESRIKFIDKQGNPSGSPLQGQVFLYFGDYDNKFRQNFSKYGLVFIHA